MKISIDSKSFVEAVQWATKDFDSRDDKAFVALKIDSEGVGSVSHANSTSFLQSNFSIVSSDLEEDFEVALQGQFVQRLAGQLDQGGSSVFTYKNNVLRLKNSLGNFTLPLVEARVPKAPEVEKLGTFDNSIYFDVLSRLSKLCDTVSAALKPAIGAIDLTLDFENSKATLMSTDMYTLGEMSLDFTPEAGADQILSENRVLLPYESSTFTVSNKGVMNTVDVVFEKKQGKFGYLFPDGKIAIFALQKAEPIPYEELKKGTLASVEKSVIVETKQIQKAISVISNLAWEENDVFLTINEKGITVQDSNSTNELTVTVSDTDFEEEESVKFIRSVINKVFSPVRSPKMKISWKASNFAFVFTPVDEDGNVDDNTFVLAIPTS